MAVTLKQLRKCFEAKKTFRTRHVSLRATRATPNLAEEMQSHLALDATRVIARDTHHPEPRRGDAVASRAGPARRAARLVEDIEQSRWRGA